MGYRFLDLRLPAVWRDWAHSDITGSWWWMRRVSLLVPGWLALVAIAVFGGRRGVWSLHGLQLVIVISGFAFVVASLTGGVRPRALRRHVPNSGPVVLWVPTPVWVPAPVRYRVAPSLLAAGVLLTLGAPFATWALLYPSSGPVSQAVSFGSDEETLAHIAALTWGAVGAGALIALLLFVLDHHRGARRLATRTLGTAGTPPTQRLPVSKLVAFCAALLLGETLICLGQLAGVIPAIFALTLAGGGLCAGPLLIALAYAAKASERTIGVDVTLHDCQRAVLGREPSISPEVGRWITTAQPVPLEGPQLP
jgi:hypothetical protein